MSAADQTISDGKLVALTYSITDTNGAVLEQADLPVTYIHGGHTELIGGMDAAIRGKQAGDIIELQLTPEHGFGAHDPNLTFTDDLDNVRRSFVLSALKCRCKTKRARCAPSSSPQSPTAN
ncbi:FKBP-type peptidyl-prolyl cis-trans isomerase [Chromatium okenii]|uniref:FKBP-type peptidyl-prolyl cis-trans isomerase n=1 Tax=Chromatium okenii TaxID=61644 RepID=UPI001F5B495B|nr:FKBP-type peptidyl-prolyl cis-trans isomerase [Chromatium okenii]